MIFTADYLNQPNVNLDLGIQPFGMTAQVPFKGTTGGIFGPSANLFSSIVIPDVTPANNDSGESFMHEAGDNKGKPSGEKLTAIQEKNRRAQKRFRERQKAKMKDMTEQLDEMTSELGKLRVENNALKNRNNILEKVLSLRDEHIRVLQDEQKVFDLGSQYLNRPTSNPKLLSYSTAPIITEASTSVDNTTTSITTDIITTDIKAIKNMPAEALISQWKDLVRELGNILVTLETFPDAEHPSHKEATQSMYNSLQGAGQLCMCTAVLHPTNMQRLIAATLDDGRSGISADDSSRWATVTASLQLTEDQKIQIVALRQIFVRRMTKVIEERRAVLSKLQAVSVPDRMVALQSVIMETLNVNEATMSLKSNLQEEHLCGMEFIGTIFKTVFTPIQKARAIVQSYPFYPDVYQIASAVAAERETPALESGAGSLVPVGSGALMMSGALMSGSVSASGSGMLELASVDIPVSYKF